jgi:hypothetical protein
VCSSDLIKKGLDEKNTSMLGLAHLGRKVVLGGEVALDQPVASSTWKKMILWAVIVGGVIILAFMARTLLREMKKSGSRSAE